MNTNAEYEQTVVLNQLTTLSETAVMLQQAEKELKRSKITNVILSASLAVAIGGYILK